VYENSEKRPSKVLDTLLFKPGSLNQFKLYSLNLIYIIDYIILFVVLPNIDQFYYRIAKKKGNSKAGVAAAAKLIKVVYWVMKERRMYERLV
jgi:hypothetical protein